MNLEALIFDVDGTLADTEETHRQAFNAAFLEFELGWEWDPALYAKLLRVSGGKERIAAYIATRCLDEAALRRPAEPRAHDPRDEDADLRRAARELPPAVASRGRPAVRGGARGRRAAGLVTIATPTRWTSDEDFGAAQLVVEGLGDANHPPGGASAARIGAPMLGIAQIRRLHAATQAAA